MTKAQYTALLNTAARSGSRLPAVIEADGTPKTAALRSLYFAHPVGQLVAARLSLGSAMKKGLGIAETAPADARDLHVEMLTARLAEVSAAKKAVLALK